MMNAGPLGELASPEGRPTAVLLIKHLPPDSTELEIADALRIYAQVKAVTLVVEPSRPGGGRPAMDPAAVVEFFDAPSATHVMASVQDLRVRGRAVGRPEYAKANAAHLVGAWLARLALQNQSRMMMMQQQQQQQQMAMQQMRMQMQHGQQLPPHGAGARAGHVAAGAAAFEPLLPRARVVAPKWPPSFEEDGAAWIFDPSSGYFVHRATEMFYEPKSKWYSKRDTATGAYAYLYHAPGHDPPFLPMPNQEQQQHINQGQPSAQQQQAQQAGSAVAASVLQQQPPPKSAGGQTAAGGDAKVKVKGTGKSGVLGTGISIAMKRTAAKDINKWNGIRSALNDEEEEKDSPTTATMKTAGSTATAAAAKAAVTVTHGSTAPAAAPSAGGEEAAGGDAAVLLRLGRDYAQLGRLRFVPPALPNDDRGSGSTATAGGALCEEQGGGKWACLVSRRCFNSEAQLAKHVAKSELYRTELTKAISEGRVFLSGGPGA